MTKTAATQRDVEAAVGRLNDLIRNHGGVVELVEYKPESEAIVIRMTGFCGSCPAWPMTLHATVIPALEQDVGISDVRVEGRRLSLAAHKRIAEAVGRSRP